MDCDVKNSNEIPVQLMCRICCVNYNQFDVISIFDHYNNKNLKYFRVIMMCIPIDIEENDQLPYYMCNGCKVRIDDAFNLREMGLDNDRKLREILFESKPTIFVEVKTELDVSNEGCDEIPPTPVNVINNMEPHGFEMAHNDESDQDLYDNNDSGEYDDEEDDEKDEDDEDDDQSENDSKIVVEKRPRKRTRKQVKNHECDVCNEKFGALKMLIRHKFKHSELINNNTTIVEIPCLEEYKCSYCSDSYKNLISVYDHINEKHKIEKNEPFKCDYCLRTYKRLEAMKCHVRKHGEQKIRRCNFCACVFEVDVKLVDHLNRHRGFKAYVCTTCNKAYNTELALKDHQRLHGDKLLLCTHCGKGFNSKSNLRTHLVLHNDEKPFPCTKCPSRFKLASGLRAHMKMHSTIRPYICDVCGSAFNREPCLAKHKRTHTGERPYSCDTCPQKFNTSYHLKRHKLTHTGERPFICKFCGKSYRQTSMLAAHLKSHLGENIYKCTTCPAAFRLQVELRQHMTEHFLAGDEIKSTEISTSVEPIPPLKNIFTPSDQLINFGASY